MLALVLSLAIMQTPQHRLFLQPNLPASESYAFFEAFPASGAGTFGACSTTPPTGAKGEALTFARTSTATCTKTGSGGLATTGIANGDLVAMPAGQPRVEYDSAGTLGLLVEASRLNNVVRSQQLDDLAWTTENVGTSAPTITADQGTAPDGTLTADRIQFAATTVGQDNIRYQAGVCGATCAGSVYIKGFSGSGTIDVCSSITGCSPCSYVSTSWTRCASQGGSGIWLVGNATLYNGGTARSANDVLVWGAQTETATYATSYIPTTSAAVTRVAETASFPPALGVMPSGCIATSVQLPANSQGAGLGWMSAAVAGPTWRNALIGTPSSASSALYVNQLSASVTNAVTTGQRRLVGYWGPAGNGSVVDGVESTSAGVTGNGTITTICVGAYGCDTATLQTGLYSRIQSDPSPSRCR